MWPIRRSPLTDKALVLGKNQMEERHEEVNRAKNTACWPLAPIRGSRGTRTSATEVISYRATSRADWPSRSSATWLVAGSLD